MQCRIPLIAQEVSLTQKGHIVILLYYPLSSPPLSFSLLLLFFFFSAFTPSRRPPCPLSRSRRGDDTAPPPLVAVRLTSAGSILPRPSSLSLSRRRVRWRMASGGRGGRRREVDDGERRTEVGSGVPCRHRSSSTVAVVGRHRVISVAGSGAPPLSPSLPHLQPLSPSSPPPASLPRLHRSSRRRLHRGSRRRLLLLLRLDLEGNKREREGRGVKGEFGAGAPVSTGACRPKRVAPRRPSAKKRARNVLSPRG